MAGKDDGTAAAEMAEEALAAYKQALALEPNNAALAKWVQMMEGIDGDEGDGAGAAV